MIHPRDYGFDMYSDLLFTSRKFMVQNPTLTERFYRATIRGWLYAFDNVEELAHIIVNKYNSQNKTLDALVYEGHALKQLAFDDDGNFGTLTLDKFNQMAQVYLITGSIYRGYDFSDFIYRPLGNIHRFSKAEQSFLNAYPVIKICVNPNWSPYEFYADNKHQGMVSDYFELIMSNVGLQYEIVPTRSWDDSLLKASLGECELIPGAMQTVQRSTYLNFTKPYLTIPAVVAIRSDSDFVSLAGKKIGVLKRSAFHDVLENRYKRSDIYPVASYLEGLRLVRSGDLDALAGADANLAQLIKEHQISDIRISDQLNDNWDISVAITEFSPYLQNILNKSINSLTPEQHSNIYDRWTVVEYEHTVDYTVLGWIGAVITGIGVLVLYRFIKISTYNGVLKEIADKDALTGILSRRKLRDEIESYIELAERHGWKLSLVFFDIDDFKQVNDQKGHAVGDQVLIKVTKGVSEMTRKTDRFGRWGGEEFIFVMLETDLEAAEIIAEKIRKKIESSDFAINQTVTCSFGVTEYEAGESLESFVARADNALYTAKEGGKNSVSVG
jgi:polar amino acid transport system substrate-binding protein